MIELIIGKKVIKGQSLEELREFAKKQSKYWEIWVTKESKVNCMIPTMRDPYSKLSDEQLKEAIRLMDRGYRSIIVQRKYHVSDDYLLKSIKEYKKRNAFEY